MTIRLAGAFLASCVLLGGCDSGSSVPLTEPSGPDSVQLDVVESHASQFAELGARPGGSQRELAASTYVLGHLQQAGYVVRLDGVPVGDLVRSTNVLALPPDGGEPAIVVVVAYDSASGDASGGEDVGLFLELARALRVRRPFHSVAFAAIGAERSRGGGELGGGLGSRRLAQWLLDEGFDPLVVSFDVAGDEQTFSASLDQAAQLKAVARSLGISEPSGIEGSDERSTVYMRAGFEHLFVAGGIGEVGRVLLEWLATTDLG